MANGAGAAYQRLQVPQDGLSQSIQFWGQKKGKTLDGIADRNERAQVREEKKRSDMAEKLDFDYGSVTGVMTGQKDFDGVTRTYAENIVNKVTDYKKLGNDALSKGDYNTYQEYLAKSQRAQASMKNWNAMSEKVGTQLAGYMEKARGGVLNPNDNRSMIFDAVLKHNYIPDVDENGNFTMLVGVDRDGDGEISEEEKQAGEAYLKDGTVVEGFEFHKVDPYQIVDGGFRVFEKVDITGSKGLINELANSIGMLKVDEKTGMYINTYQGWDESKRPQLEAYAEGKLQDPETMAWVLSQATGSKKASNNIEDYTPEEMQAAKDYIVNGTVDRFSTTKTTAFNSGLANYQLGNARLAEQKRANKAREAKKKTPEEEAMSNLHFDAKAFENGDPTALYGRYEVDGMEMNVTKVLDNGDHYIAIDEDTGQKTKVNKNSRSFLEFKIRNNSEYKGITPEKVYSTQPNQYRDSEEIGVSEVTKDFESFFDSSGRFNGDDAKFAKKISDKYGVEASDIEWFGKDIIEVNGVRIDLKQTSDAMIKLDNAIKNSDKGILD